MAWHREAAATHPARSERRQARSARRQGRSRREPHQPSPTPPAGGSLSVHLKRRGRRRPPPRRRRPRRSRPGAPRRPGLERRPRGQEEPGLQPGCRSRARAGRAEWGCLVSRLAPPRSIAALPRRLGSTEDRVQRRRRPIARSLLTLHERNRSVPDDHKDRSGSWREIHVDGPDSRAYSRAHARCLREDAGRSSRSAPESGSRPRAARR
jgi:hypothetical protein